MTKYNRIFQNMSTYLRIYPKYKELSEKKKKGFFFLAIYMGNKKATSFNLYFEGILCARNEYIL